MAQTLLGSRDHTPPQTQKKGVPSVTFKASNDDNPPVFVIRGTYGERFFGPFSPNQKKNFKKTRDSGMCLKITTCEQRQTRQLTRIQVAGILRKKNPHISRQHVHISLPKNITQKKIQNQPHPPFGHVNIVIFVFFYITF